MSQRVLLACDFQGCNVRLECVQRPGQPTDGIDNWMCLTQPSMMNREIDLCPEHAKLVNLSSKVI